MVDGLRGDSGLKALDRRGVEGKMWVRWINYWVEEAIDEAVGSVRSSPHEFCNSVLTISIGCDM